MTRPIIHALTPGDHFSPRTGSAIPTVVHGLAQSSDRDGRSSYSHHVLLDSSTMHPRYSSATVIEYEGTPFPSRIERTADALGARLGLPRRTARRSYRPLADAVSSREPSIIVAHNAPVLTPLPQGSRHSVVLYAHNDLFRTMSRAEATKRVAAAAAVVCVSSDLAERMASRLPSSLTERIHVVENGVDTDQFTPADRQEFRPLRVLFVGRTIADKGPDVLLDAAALLGRDNIEVVIVGSHGFDREAALSPFERALRERAAGAGVRAVFEPFVDRFALPKLLQSADIFVAPSRWPEPSGLTIGEAMATGLAVIASKTGGIPEVLGDAGILVAPGDATDLASGLELLADDATARATLGSRARARAVERSWDRSWLQLKAVLDSI